MRDLDLLVSVTTVASDSIWLDKFSGHYDDLGGYWNRVARDGLDQLLTHRREVLAPFYADQEPSGRFELTERELIVRGR